MSHTSISKSQAKKLVKDGATIIDLRSPVHFRDAHAPNAINLTLRQFVNRLMGDGDKKKSYIIYSVTPEDVDVYYAKLYASSLGFTKVFVSDLCDLR